MTQGDYIKKRDEILDKNEDGWFSRQELAQAIDALVLEVIDAGHIKMNDLGADAYEALGRVTSKQRHIVKGA